jgi:Uma2 family endonuclease
MSAVLEHDVTTDSDQELDEHHPATVADLLESLGGISAERVLLHPQPGTATEADLLRLPHDVQRLCELIDGTLVVKAMGAPESVAAACLIMLIGRLPGIFQLAVVMGGDGHTRYFGNQVRMPDVAVILRSRLPDGKLPKEQICPVPPDLAVEVLSPGNTRKEMAKKLKTFFDSGVQVVWLADPRKRTVRIHTSPKAFTELNDDGILEGGDILPGFRLSVREWFDSAE